LRAWPWGGLPELTRHKQPRQPRKKTVKISSLLLLPSFRVNTAPFADAKVPFGVLYDLFVVFYLVLEGIFV
jgi:hypothetical protein